MRKKILNMRGEQFKQVTRQITAYEKQGETRTIQINIDGENIDIEVDPKVANPEIMNSGLQIVKFLTERRDIVDDKIVNDMGTGCGLIGLCSALLGAKKVFMEDIDPIAVKNTLRNVKKLNLTNKSDVFVSDLFCNYGDRPKTQVQIFNHPFFSAEPISGKDWTRMMLGGTELIERYLKEAPKYSTTDALYIFPWLTLADSGDGLLDNNPAKRGTELGYELIETVEQRPTNVGIQQAPFKIYVLKHKSINI